MVEKRVCAKDVRVLRGSKAGNDGDSDDGETHGDLFDRSWMCEGSRATGDRCVNGEVG